MPKPRDRYTCSNAVSPASLFFMDSVVDSVVEEIFQEQVFEVWVGATVFCSDRRSRLLVLSVSALIVPAKTGNRVIVCSIAGSMRSMMLRMPWQRAIRAH